MLAARRRRIRGRRTYSRARYAPGAFPNRASRNGKEIFFAGRNLGMWSVEVDGAGQFTIGDRRPLFDLQGLGVAMSQAHQSYDVSPDGQRFLMVAPKPRRRVR